MIRFLNDDNGATAVEYGVIVMLIATVIIGSLTVLGVQVSSMSEGVHTVIFGVGR
ncbi:MAG: Flp pilus assembly pilin Flp [Myxococcota bacterium]|jgi:Flp pilus assembly pilin Flp